MSVPTGVKRAYTAGGLRPPAAPVTGMYGGWVEGGISSINSFESTHGVTIGLGHEFGDSSRWDWFENGTGFDQWAQWVNAKPGRRFSYSSPLCTVNGDSDYTSPDGKTSAQKLATGASGAYDSHFTNLGQAFQQRPALRNSIVRLGWEMNGENWPWSIPPNNSAAIADYKEAFRRAAAALKAACPTLKIEWCPNCQLDATGVSFDVLYPTAANHLIDVIGIGLYDYYWPGGTPSNTTRWNWLQNGETGVNGLAHQVLLARRYRKALGHTEWGLWDASTSNPGGAGDNPWFIIRLNRWHRLHGYAYSIYNNIDSVGIHELGQYPNGLAAYVRAVKSDGMPAY